MSTVSAKTGPAFGWSTVSITPNRPVQLHGQHYERVSQSVRDEIHATVCIVASGDARGYADTNDAKSSGADPDTAESYAEADIAVLISCDLVAVPKDLVAEIRDAITQRIPEIGGSNIMVAATHTHTAPVMSDGQYPPPADGVMTPTEYRRFLTSRLVEATGEAWDDRKPGLIGWEFGYASVGFNRRTRYLDGRSVMYGDTSTELFAGMEGGNDHGVELLYVFDTSGNLRGVAVNLACPSQVVECQLFISGDFWSSVRRRVQERLGHGVHVLPLCAAAGDQSPRDLVRGMIVDGIDFYDESGLEELGERITKCIEERFAAAKSRMAPAEIFRHRVRELDLPGRRITDQEAQSLREEIRRYLAENAAPETFNGGRLKKAQQALHRYDVQSDTPVFPAEVHAVRLDDRVIVTNPFELFLDYGLRIKARSTARQTFVTQLVGDRGLYLPTEQAVGSGHYGTIPTESFVGPDGGAILVESTLELIDTVFDGSRNTD